MPRVAALALVCLLLATASRARVLIGALSELQHDVSGDVYALNNRQLLLENFNYDGEVAGAFWFDTGSSATANGVIGPIAQTCEITDTLPEFRDATVIVEVPGGMTLSDIGYFSVWCTSVDVEFGGIRIDAASLQNVPELATPNCTTPMSVPVQPGWSCEQLSPNYQVRWRVQQPNISFELVARLNGLNRYMGFGPSGNVSRTQMLGGDAVIAYRTQDSYRAVDYYMGALSQCASGEGVCPDTDPDRDTPGTNNVFDVAGNFTSNLTVVTFSRPLAAVDAMYDTAIRTDGPQFVIWAIGPLNDEQLPLFHGGPMEFPSAPVSIDFSRAPENRCGRISATPTPEAKVPGFLRPVIANVTKITARIGPSGGARGVSGIRDTPSWGIAWYLSETGSTGDDVLIPAVGVERGKTYTFSVYGGLPSASGTSIHHPFYITSDERGGYDTRTPGDRKNETVYAGIRVDETDASGGVTKYTATAQGELCNFEGSLKPEEVNKLETYDEFYDSLNTSCVRNQTITDGAGKLVWKVAEDTPDQVWYQCVTHQWLGFKIRVFDNGKTDIDVLKGINGGRALNDTMNDSCSVSFKGEQRTFDSCNLDLRAGGMEVYWQVVGDEIETLFRAPDTFGYTAFGWGYNEMVQNGSSTVAAVFNGNGSVQISSYELTSKSTAGVQPTRDGELTDTDAENANGYIAGLFKRKLKAAGLPTLQERDNTAIWATGRASSPTTFQNHGGANRGFGVLKNGEPTTKQSLASIFVVHGALMGVSWIILLPTGVTAMRYFKKNNPTTFNIHRIINTSATLLTIAAFIMAVVRGSHTEIAHLVIGSIVLALALLQVIGGAVRPAKTSTTRKPWKLGHQLLGMIAVSLGITNAFLGISTALVKATFDSGVPVVYYVLAAVGLGIWVAANLILSAFPAKFPTTEGTPQPQRETEENQTDEA